MNDRYIDCRNAITDLRIRIAKTANKLCKTEALDWNRLATDFFTTESDSTLALFARLDSDHALTDEDIADSVKGYIIKTSH